MTNKKTFFDSLFVVFFHYNSVSCVITDRFSSKNIYTCSPSILCPLFIGGSGFLKIHKIFKIKTFCKYRRGVFKKPYKVGVETAHYLHSLHAKRLLGVPQNGFYEWAVMMITSLVVTIWCTFVILSFLISLSIKTLSWINLLFLFPQVAVPTQEKSSKIRN